MPEEPRWLESLRAQVSGNATLNRAEKAHREAVLNEISVQLQQAGPHLAKAHANRARQFMPFAALKGYHELAYERERVQEQKHAMSEDLALELTEATSRLAKGSQVLVMHYEGGQYITTSGEVEEIDDIFCFMRIGKKRIAFDDILSIEVV